MDSLEQKYLDSREVAEMVGKEHNMLLRDIRRYVEQLGQSKIAQSDFFKESNIQNPDGSVRITRTTKVTGKGQIYFVNKFMKSEVTA